MLFTILLGVAILSSIQARPSPDKDIKTVDVPGVGKVLYHEVTGASSGQYNPGSQYEVHHIYIPGQNKQLPGEQTQPQVTYHYIPGQNNQSPDDQGQPQITYHYIPGQNNQSPDQGQPEDQYQIIHLPGDGNSPNGQPTDQVVEVPASNGGCNDGLIPNVVNTAKDTINGGINGVGDFIGTGLTMNGTLLGPVGGAVQAIERAKAGVLTNVVSGVGGGVNRIACGVNNIVGAAANALETGDIIGGVANIGKEAINGVVDTVGGLAGHAIQGIGAIGDAFMDFVG